MTKPTKLIVAPEIFDRFPHVVLGVVTGHGLDNSGGPDSTLPALRLEESHLRTQFEGVSVSEHPHIAPWRETYRAFGAKPKDYPSSIENLVRRVTKGDALPHVNALVDVYNTLSLRYVIPVGGEDLDTIVGDVFLTFATDHEAPVRLLGEPESRPPKPGEVIYKDDIGAICRRWNWKEADRTKLTPRTRNAFLVIEGLPPVGASIVEGAAHELARLVKSQCGGAMSTGIVSVGNQRITLSE